MGFLAYVYHHRLLLAGAALAAYAVRAVRTYWRLRHFGGPFGTGFSQLWHVGALLSWKPHTKYREASDKYGSIARIGPNDLVTSSPELVFHMNAARSAYTRGDYYYRAARFEAGKDHVFSELEEDKHKRRRQQLAAGVRSPARNPTRGPQFNLARRSTLARTTRASRPLWTPASPSFSTSFASNIYPPRLAPCPSTLGKRSSISPSMLSAASASANPSATSAPTTTWTPLRRRRSVNTLLIALNLTKFIHLPLVFRLVGPSEKDQLGMGKLVANARAIVKGRIERGMATQTDMIASFARHGLSEEELVSETCLQIIAGSETTASSLKAIFLYLLSHPRVYSKLQAEVVAAVPSAGTTAPDALCKRLPYLQAVIKEANRMHPPVTSQLPKRVPDGGDTVVVDGAPVFLPGGALISYSMVALNRRRDVFGEDADEFRPERWLVGDGETLGYMTRVHEVIFGNGKNGCLGKGIALLEIGKVVFEMLRHFDWSLANPERPWTEHNYVGFYVHSDMLVTASERHT